MNVGELKRIQDNEARWKLFTVIELEIIRMSLELHKTGLQLQREIRFEVMDRKARERKQ